jgi:cytochrome c553
MHRRVASRKVKPWRLRVEGRRWRAAPCHGADLNGLGPVPGIAGPSPSYLVRQMYDIQAARKGVWTPLMTKVVSQLSEADMLEIAAYAASLKA